VRAPGAHAHGCKTHFAKSAGVIILSRSLSQHPWFRKFKDGRTMAFVKNQSKDPDELRDLVYGWGKVVTRRAFGEAGPGLDLDFDTIESLAVDAAQSLIRGTIEEALRCQFQLLGDDQPCPQCTRRCPVEKSPRTLAVRGGTIDYEEPKCHCPACRRDFFPSASQFATRYPRLLSGDLG
jgi:hypothetical protein